MTVQCYRLSVPFPKSELYGLTAQLRSAALSITCNVAEGNGRDSTKDHLRFLAMARGSLRETIAILHVARDLGFGSAEAIDQALNLADRVGRMMTALRRRLVARLRAPG